MKYIVEYFKQIFKMQTFGNGKYARQNYMWTSITLVCHADDGVMTFNPPSVLGTNPTFLWESEKAVESWPRHMLMILFGHHTGKKSKDYNSLQIQWKCDVWLAEQEEEEIFLGYRTPRRGSSQQRAPGRGRRRMELPPKASSLPFPPPHPSLLLLPCPPPSLG